MPTISPIFKVEQDVLWRIFTAIAHSRPGLNDGEHTEDQQTENHPLTVMRNISQVCFKWRRLVIESSSIWGGMIDMAVMGKISENWRALIMKRTKEATLCIYGDVRGSHEVTRSFFSSLLANEWHRISELNVTISFCEEFDNDLWTTFWDQPALHLTRFAVTLQHASSSEPVDIGQKCRTLFKGHAPSLMALHTTQLHVDPRASWMSGLIELTLCSHLSAFQVLDIICGIPRLEVLYLLSRGYHADNVHDLPESSAALRQTILPNLRRLHISSTFQTCSALLSHIHLPQDAPCELTVISTNRSMDGEISLVDIEAFIPVLIKCTQRYLQSYKVTGFGVIMSLGYFGVIFDHPLGRDNHPSTRQSAMHILNHIRFPPTSHSQLLKAISTCELSAVTKLTLTTTSGKGIDSTDPSFHSLLLALSGVETLIVPEASVQLLNDVGLDVSTIFPSLKTLKLDFLSRRVSLRLDESIKLFLARRVNVGNPVAVLDISRFVTGYEERMNWTFVDSIGGLKVLWSSDGITREYICGTGSAETLNFL